MTNIEKHKKLCEEIHETYISKNEKYGDSFSKTVSRYGKIAALTRMSDKFARIENLILTGDSGVDTDESLYDTLLDLANYCLMSKMAFEEDE